MRAFCLLIVAILSIGVLVGSSHANGPVTNSSSLELVAGRSPISITIQSLTALPSVEADVTFKTSKGASSGHYKGVLIWDLFKANHVLDDLGHNAELRKTFTVVASDGYEIAFSIGEIHPDFGNTAIMLATEVDGRPFTKGFRIVVPGDTRGARDVRDVTRIELH